MCFLEFGFVSGHGGATWFQSSCPCHWFLACSGGDPSCSHLLHCLIPHAAPAVPSARLRWASQDTVALCLQSQWPRVSTLRLTLPSSPNHAGLLFHIDSASLTAVLVIPGPPAPANYAGAAAYTLFIAGMARGRSQTLCSSPKDLQQPSRRGLGYVTVGADLGYRRVK